MTGSLTVKQGASWCPTLTFTEADGTPTPLTGAQVRAQVRDGAGALVCELAFAPTATSNAVVAVADTTAWPIGTLRCDISYLRAGLRVISPTFTIRVDPAVTQPI